MPSPWVVREFWDRVVQGLSPEEAGLAVGVSGGSGRRRFVDSGGVKPKFPVEGPRLSVAK